MAFINKVDNLNNLQNISKTNKKGDSLDFEKMLKNEIDSTNKLLEESEKAQADIATGQVEDLARASITIQKAEMKMKMMLEVRNKAINAYKELMKTQI
ncbi:flagellar hook-basal body complex protein FliE [Caminibacter pacificus]|uniref:Flagellar hook-basal body complex protein FliE n=1 Tax=Caminibacter pacificus TaxID=1424653 RepID=A0AAJ4RBP0_9BACT|nr:flagellar hook-basal body complex protein FliE [Caminibacter pacificus]QCI29071.1 flagellar hook-basal body complex protein FliE [Caminibacter pacificus]ROR39110.1 flagellar hook-basal body complex protein FliE [Caminibacter pacificus]